MKKALILLLLTCHVGFYLLAQSCLEEGIILTTQEEIDNFSANYPDCTEVLGFVTIEESIPGDITNLAGLSHLISVNDLFIRHLSNLQDLSDLSSLTQIRRDLGIVNNTSLTSLTGLENVMTMTSMLVIERNPLLSSLNGLGNPQEIGSLNISLNESLSDVSALQNLTQINSVCHILENPALQNLDDLGNLISVGGTLWISGNAVLESISGLASLNTVGAGIAILDNPQLINLNGLSSLTNVESLFIGNNTAQESLTGLEQLTTINGQLNIIGLDQLESLTPLANLQTIGSHFNIRNCGRLPNLTGLSALNSIGGSLTIDGNNMIQDLSSLSALISIGDALAIERNPSLLNLTGLAGLTTLSGSLVISDNASLGSLSGLTQLQNIGGLLTISRNPSLLNLNGLEALTISGGGLYIDYNDALQNLQGINSITSFSGSLSIINNLSLTSLSGSENLNFISTNFIFLTDNPLLAACGQENICDYIFNGGNVIVFGNASGCTELSDLLLSCFDGDNFNSLVGRVIADLDEDCTEDDTENGIARWLIQVTSDNFNYAVSTDSFGNYWLPVLDGAYTLNLIAPTPYWESCFADTTLQLTGLGDSIQTDFFMQPLGDCPFLDWDVFVPPLRICETSTITVQYCSNGSVNTIADGIFSIQLDPLLTLESASIPYSTEPDGTLLFSIDTIDWLACNAFTLDVFLDCEEAMIGDTPCVEVSLLSEELCDPGDSWDGSLIAVSGHCENDSIYFELENIGTGAMSVPAQFRVEIVIDDIVLMLEVDDYQLQPGASQSMQYPVQGQGIRLAADQTPGHPLYAEVSAVIPNCESSLNDSLLILLPMNDGDPFSEVICAPATNSYDPNDKSAVPAGLGEDHEIDKNWELEYTIRFQNTGNDVAYEVVIKDTLSVNLDLATLSVQGASHPYTWALNPGRELVFTFENILLPDSTFNEPESHGFVQYSIKPKSDLLPGVVIQNRAGIYFDFNDPIITNTVFHTIRKPIVTTSERLSWCAGDIYNDLPILEDTLLQTLTSFTYYDSIHFVHLKVKPVSYQVILLDIPFGEYFDDVLIENDTSFSIQHTSQNGCDSLVSYTISVITETEEVDAPFSKVKIAPNPTRDVLRIQYHQNEEAQQWRLVNSLGQVVWQRRLKPFEDLHEVIVDRFPSGLYFLHLKTRSTERSWKVLIQE